MIQKEIIHRVLEAADNDLLRVIQTVCPGIKLQRQGISYTACCPLHGERTPSFYITPSKRIWKCFGCGEGGGALRFVMRYENLTYIEAVRRLGSIVGIPVAQPKNKRPEWVKVAPVQYMQFEYRALSAHDLELCGVQGATESDTYIYSMKTGLFALKSYTNPARKGENYSWKIMEASQYPILMFCYKNSDRSEWGTLFQPEAEVGKQLRNFGIRRGNTAFFSEKIRDFACGLRDGAINEINLKGILE
ncbi:CHC2 zinc finger domain-containing protein [Parabacteroides sp. W1-Q-101]|uniref:CHC2 zinc finger domain-containing protein n=1 Tax=Parabacteroides caeci TaxID=2949650 RepID=UPI00202FFB73|nr:CHC2 zinc finger domain-containing protein [Parabacteroides sp. W1-Q-101]MCM0717332.1 CHC2 zinc finger domain-containing protein [Parabacteroides sp. W1-Q-101]